MQTILAYITPIYTSSYNTIDIIIEKRNMSSYSAAARSTLARSDSPMPMDTSSIRSATSRSTSNKMDTSDRSHDDISIISELMNRAAI